MRDSAPAVHDDGVGESIRGLVVGRQDGADEFGRRGELIEDWRGESPPAEQPWWPWCQRNGCQSERSESRMFMTQHCAVATLRVLRLRQGLTKDGLNAHRGKRAE